jgi:hypothetical protein
MSRHSSFTRFIVLGYALANSLVAFGATCNADVLVTSSGRKYEGTVSQQADGSWQITLTNGGSLTFPGDMVEQIMRQAPVTQPAPIPANAPQVSADKKQPKVAVHEKSHQTLREAFQVLGHLKPTANDPTEGAARGIILQKILEAQAEIGDAAGAHETRQYLRQLDIHLNIKTRPEADAALASAYARAGDLATAKHIAAGLTDLAGGCVGAYAAIAEASTATSDAKTASALFDQAEQIALTSKKSFDKAMGLELLAQAYVRARMLPNAVRILKLSETQLDESDRRMIAYVYFDVAVAQDAVGDREGFRLSLENLSTTLRDGVLRQAILNRAKALDMEGVEQGIGQIDDPFFRGLTSFQAAARLADMGPKWDPVCRAVSKAGSEALAQAEEGSPRFKMILRDMLVWTAKRMDPPERRNTWSELLSEVPASDQVPALIEMALTLNHAGQRDKSKDFFRRAVAKATDDPNYFDLSDAFCRWTSEAEMPDARDIMDSVEPPVRRAACLIGVAKAQIQTENVLAMAATADVGPASNLWIQLTAAVPAEQVRGRNCVYANSQSSCGLMIQRPNGVQVAIPPTASGWSFLTHQLDEITPGASHDADVLRTLLGPVPSQRSIEKLQLRKDTMAATPHWVVISMSLQHD